MYNQIHFNTPKKRSRIYLNCYLTDTERKSLIAACGEAAYLLFEYYIRMSSLNVPETIDDNKIANYFGWTVPKAQRVRLRLIKKGWLDQAKYTLSNGNKGITYYIGLDAVKAHRTGVEQGW